ncbi:phosphoribosylformimino-5-aminoimidazole carboxamide ribotide isomerase [Faecalicatena sp. AGMB00832]|uniref:Phosphoribosylformimino-5-aminoimidazole carboxamide ribotide isomerase n=1 Tax=Faecalicatena faecalis TaxID=2726362 RepID=A0ABS6D0Q0_9FIRM|nr:MULTISPECIES: phosphoribosylformimino-5-aminoimidazole carboxamide ribotide isomerase [Faecalicatena]MBU3874812.1 phosphoribosylformimino-5-aminoimidazole carboxamide ribotide isomerase [Faecalicatena faecalis]MCI6465819.1 phosphoribosylformimino-5-aminoimidazole carboxamide ribotide isomerase [Faecalicatena sp.]MDY5618765.1 phosphoribosylformimino-5-aminoimidazole carboxamide ribotide isomerase [Lachnospiraceae bacterium]
MKFRPCIDIHNGKVKQIVGGSLKDQGDQAVTNFSTELDAAWYASQYRKDGLKGGHIILLNPVTSEFYEATKRQAIGALKAYPKGMQIGGGITAENAAEYLDAGASHVIVTSYVFQNGKFHKENLAKLVSAVGREHIVLDLSCRKKNASYYIVTDRWQTFTDVRLTPEVLDQLSGYCDEFLVHGVDVEGKASGVELELVRMLGEWNRIPITYAGGIGSMEDLEEFSELCQGKLDFTIGSALDLFGGKIPYENIARL